MQSKELNYFAQLDQAKLKRILEIKQAYAEGNLSRDEAKERMSSEVGQVSPAEYAAAEQLLKEDNPDECRTEDVRTMLDLFDGLIPQEQPPLPYGHPIDAYLRENEAMRTLLLRGEDLLKKNYIHNPWAELLDEMSGYKIHWSRKQNQLYAALEHKGFDRPSTTMWTYDDYIRDLLNTCTKMVQEDAVESLYKTFEETTLCLRDLMGKEELILYPTALKMLSEADFEEMKQGDREIGFCWITMPAYQKKNNTPHMTTTAPGLAEELGLLLAKYGIGTAPEQGQVLDVAEGKLTLEQINLLYQHMPVDISYVDEHDLVAFYTDTPHRVFPRSKGVIGRAVKHCHPPKSVHLVEEIIAKFRSGEQDKIDFWINKPEVFIYILYVAVRDANGKFRGVMEMMQDCTHIRALQGSRTLLTWDEEKQQAVHEGVTAEETDEEETITPQLITAETKLKTLIKAYPQLLKDLPQISPKFKQLQSPMAKLMLPFATVQMMSERSDMPLPELITALRALLSTYTQP